MLNIWENSCILPSHQNHPGEPNTQSRTETCRCSSYRPAGVFKQSVPQRGAKNPFSVLQILISSLSGWDKSMVYWSFSWKTEKLGRRQGENDRASACTTKSIMSKASTCKAIQGSDVKLKLPHLEVSPPGSGPLSTNPSASFQLPSLQCAQTMQYLLGQRETDSMIYWLRHSTEMDSSKLVASLFQWIITDVK